MGKNAVLNDAVAENAAVMLRRGDTAQAIAYLTSQKSLTPRAADYLSDAYFQARDWEKALAAVRANLRRAPTPARRMVEAKILSNLRRHEEALASVRMILRQSAENVDALVVAKICSHFLGDRPAALGYGQKALAVKDRLAGTAPPWEWQPRQASGRVIAFSVFGTARIYLAGAAINIVLAPRHFPGWKVRLYCDARLDPRWLSLYERLGADVVRMDVAASDVTPYFWRFLVADDPQVGVYLCRDADSRLTADEASLVAEWLASGKPFHVVRDHVLHDDPMLAGLWGGTGSDALRMRELIATYFNGRPTAKYGHDQIFLGRAVWPRIRHLAFVHDRFYETRGVESHRHTFDTDFGASKQADAEVVAEAVQLGIDLR